MPQELGLKGRKDGVEAHQGRNQVSARGTQAHLDANLEDQGHHGCQHEEEVEDREVLRGDLHRGARPAPPHLLAREAEEGHHEGQGLHREVHEVLAQEESHVRVEHPQEALQGEVQTQTHPLSSNGLLPIAHGYLAVEGHHAHKAHVAPFAHMEVLAVGRPTSAQFQVDTGKDVLRQIQPLGRLGDASLLQNLELVHDVRMAVVEARFQGPVHGALDHGAEGKLQVRRHLPEQAHA
mmetsp:Transcript_35909/g.103205  ORF Transcript_35909/g.103205 Transcript_35909/m.103205 type:complete len:236 (+) Transcript_35909:1098-1805(+)